MKSFPHVWPFLDVIKWSANATYHQSIRHQPEAMSRSLLPPVLVELASQKHPLPKPRHLQARRVHNGLRMLVCGSVLATHTLVGLHDTKPIVEPATRMNTSHVSVPLLTADEISGGRSFVLQHVCQQLQDDRDQVRRKPKVEDGSRARLERRPYAVFESRARTHTHIQKHPYPQKQDRTQKNISKEEGGGQLGIGILDHRVPTVRLF